MGLPVATSGLALTLDKARDLMSNITAFQTIVGAASAAAAKARIYMIGVPSDPDRPFCLVDFMDRAYTRDTHNGFRLDGKIIFWFEFPVSDDYVDSHNDAWLEFFNRIGDIEAGIKALSNTSGYQEYSSIMVDPASLERTSKEDRQGGHVDVISGAILCEYWGV